MKPYFTPGRRPFWIGGKNNPSTFFSQWTNSGVKVDLFAHLKNTLPKEFKFFRGLLLKCSDLTWGWGGEGTGRHIGRPMYTFSVETFEGFGNRPI